MNVTMCVCPAEKGGVVKKLPQATPAAEAAASEVVSICIHHLGGLLQAGPNLLLIQYQATTSFVLELVECVRSHSTWPCFCGRWLVLEHRVMMTQMYQK